MSAQSYASDTFGLPVAVTRFSNVYGPGQLNPSAVIPDAITSAQGYSRFVPKGDGSQERNFVFVDDAISLYLRIGEALYADPARYSGEVFNAGTRVPTSIRSLVTMIYQLAGTQRDLDVVLGLMQARPSAVDADQQAMDFGKISEHFGWCPEHTVTEGLQKTIEWFARFNETRFRN
jgi:CDP-glucose 4,6-dehydratase